MSRLMARRPAPGDPVRVDGFAYVVTAELGIPNVIEVERPCKCEWLLLDLVQMHWDLLRGHWRADRGAVLAIGGNR